MGVRRQWGLFESWHPSITVNVHSGLFCCHTGLERKGEIGMVLGLTTWRVEK